MFKYILKGVVCVVQVDYYQRACPMRITGTGFGDAEPPEDEEFEFHLLKDGHLAPELDELLDDYEIGRILATYKALRGIK